MKKLLYYSVLAGIASAAFFACVDTHETLPYVDPNTQYKQEQENAGILEEGTFISEKFSSSLGTCKSVSDNESVNYVIDFSSAKVTGNINSTKNAATVYLVSPTVNLSSADSAYYTFEHIIAYETGDLLQDEQFLVSLDYNGEPSKATWTQLPMSAVLNTGKPASWSEFISTAFNLPKEYLKSSVTFAFKYTSTTSSAATWEIKNFSVKTGSITETVAYENPKVKETSPEEPLTVTEALASKTSATAKSYVTGYIVGYVDGQKLAEGAAFSIENCKVESNILIAASATEKDVKNCMPVQLPANTKHRTALNLSANKDILGKQIVLGGYIQSYFGANGLKSLFYSALEGIVIDAPAESTGFDGKDNTTELTDMINLSFKESGIDKFSIYNFNKAEDLGHLWTNSSQYGMVAKGSAADNKAWLISPRVDVSKCEKIEFTFNHAANNFPENEGVDKKCAVYVSKDYAGDDPSKATWTKLNLEKWSSNWTWEENSIDLTEYKSDNLHIAFEYTSAAQDGEKIGSFEIDKVYLGALRKEETPVNGYDGGDNTVSKTLTEISVSLKKDSLKGFSIYDFEKYALQDKNIWFHTKEYGAKATANKNAKSWLITPKTDLSKCKKVEFTFNHSANNFATEVKDYCAVYISKDFLGGDPEKATWTKLEIAKWSSNWTWTENTFDLTEYKSDNVHIAFEYISKMTDTKHGTFEVDNIYLGESRAEEVPVSGFDGSDNTKETVKSISINFTDGIDKFSVYDFIKYASADKNIWTIDETYGAKSKGNKTSKSWLISPRVDLSGAEKIDFTFSHAANFFAGKVSDECAVYVSSDYKGGDPSKATWTKLEIQNWAKDWTFVDNTIDFTEYKSDNVHIAFEYTSDSEKTKQGTFEIKEFYLGDSRMPETAVSGYDGQSTQKEAAIPFEYDFKTQQKLGDFLVYDSERYQSKDEHIWKASQYGATATSNKEAESWLISPKFTLENDKKYSLEFTNWYKNAATPQNSFKAFITDNFTGDFATTKWSALDMTFGEIGKNNDVKLNLSTYAGKTVVIAFKYTSTKDEKGTFEVIKFSVKEVIEEIEETPISGFDKTVNITDFSVYDIKKYASANEHIWTSNADYITASADKEAESWLISKSYALESGKNYQLSFTTNTDKTADEAKKFYKAYVFENYNSGTPNEATQTELTVSFAQNQNKTNTIDLSSYAGKTVNVAFQYTSKDDDKGKLQIKDFLLEEILPEEPVKGFDGANTIITVESFPWSYNFKTEKKLGDFLVYDVKRFNSKDSHIWIADNSYGAKATSKEVSESWLISPKFTLESGNEYELSITNTYMNAANPSQVYSAHISTDYNDNPETATWGKLNLEFGAAKEAKVNTTDLSQYAGQSVVVAFKYTSTETEKGTFEIFNFSLSKVVKEEVPVSGIDENANITDFTVYDVKRFASVDEHIWKNTADGIAANANKESESWLVSKSFNLESNANYQLSFSVFNDKAADDAKKVYKAYVLKNYNNGNPNDDADKKELTVSFGKNQTKNNTFDLSEYAGQNINIAFKYSSTDQDKGIFRISKFSMEKDEIISGFDGEDNTSTVVSSLDESFKANLGVFSVYDVLKHSTDNEHIWSSTKYGAVSTMNKESESWLISPLVNLESNKKYELKFTSWYQKPKDENYKMYISTNYQGG
ncbi:MAG: DUF5017 domain-containing protein, partial [Bacteroidales bacterium]|nr:DUF5017 domain-containing protein [Bacteroidales bacterium]